MPANKGQIFRYPVSVIVGVGLAPLPLAGLVGYIIATAHLDHRFLNWAWQLALLLLALYLVPGLMLSIVRVDLDDRGISTHWFGLRTERLEWSGVSRIVHRAPVPGGAPPKDFIDVVGRKGGNYIIIPNVFGRMMISELLEDYGAFKLTLTKYAKLHDIPLYFVDEFQARSQKTREARLAWLKTGVPVDEL